MQLPVLWQRGQQKPFGSIPRINPAHPLASGLVTYCYDLGGIIIDLVNNGRATLFSSTTHAQRGSSPFGNAFKYGATSSSDWATFRTNPNVTTFGTRIPYTIACATFYTGAPIVNTVVVGPSTNDNGGNQGPVFWIDGTNTLFSVVLNNANPHDFAQARTTNTFQSWVCAVTSTTAATFYANGTSDAGSFSGSATTQSNSGLAVVFNGGGYTTAQFTGGAGNGLVYYYAGWNRVLTSAEALLLHTDPYCFLIYPEDEMFAELVNIAAAGNVTSSWGFEQETAQQNVFRTYGYKRGLIVPKEDGIIKEFVNWQNVGFEIQPPPPPHVFKERRGAITPKEDGIEQILINWQNAGWEVQSVQPPHRRPERNASIIPKEDGIEIPFVRWFNFGWEIQSVQPPVPYGVQRSTWVKLGGATAKGDDGTESPFSNWYNSGWEIQAHQPPHPFWEKRGAVVPKEDGTESPFVKWYNSGFDNQIGHWKWTRTKDPSLFGDSGIENVIPQSGFVTSGWGFDPPFVDLRLFPNVRQRGAAASGKSDFASFNLPSWTEDLAWQPYRYPFGRHAGGLLRGIDGSESPLVNWFNAGWEIQPYQVKPGRLRFRILSGSEDGLKPAAAAFVTSGWGFDPQFMDLRTFPTARQRYPGTKGSSAFALFPQFYPAGWEIQAVQPKYTIFRGGVLPRGDDSLLPPATSVIVTSGWGFDPQPIQPPNRNFRGSVLLRGDELAPPPLFVTSRWGFEIQSPMLRAYPVVWQRGAGASGRSNFASFNLPSWTEDLAWQPFHIRYARAAGIMYGDDGIEAVYIFVPPPVNMAVYRPLMGAGI